MSIRPLPAEVVAQIRSSTVIVSLTGVVLELLSNSLDANATKIEVTVDFARGGCTVEDNGFGIAPSEFRENGGLGKLYYTSKYQSQAPHLGQHGTFLASLSAMSLLTITSRHHAYRSHNSVSFHHSQVIERQTPTSTHNHIHNEHGTRVTVRNLFGNMPVRVKQRSIVLNQKVEQLRLREALKKGSVGVLLGWQGPVSLQIRDGDNNTIVNFNTSNTTTTEADRCTTAGKKRPAHLSSLLHIMTQARYIAIDDWVSWVPASASTAALSIKGAISLLPSPTKHVQFISFGLRPISSEFGRNELHDQVNRLFAQSSFGVLEDDADVDNEERVRRQSDKRFKSDGYTGRQLKSRKGVDRFPMYHLSILLKDSRASDLTGDRFIEDESNLQTMVDILGAMIRQWLLVHHFRPRNPRRKPDELRTASASTSGSDKSTLTLSENRGILSGTPTRSLGDCLDPQLAATGTAKRRRLETAPFGTSSSTPRQHAFAEWSRIKSGKSSFFESSTVAHKKNKEFDPEMPTCLTLKDEVGKTSHSESQQEHTAFNAESSTTSTLGEPGIRSSENKAFSVSEDADPTMFWTDPSTRKMHLLNARTGCVIPSKRPQPLLDRTAPTLTATKGGTSEASRMTLEPATTEATKTPWLDGFLQTWNNPVFRPSEKRIQQISFQHELEQGAQSPSQCDHARCSHFDVGKAFRNAGSSSAKLSKEGLRTAQVISQIDRKFVLVKMGVPALGAESRLTGEILVLIDQHAADERVQVESLLAGLCKPVEKEAHAGYQSQLGLSSPVAFVILEKPLRFVLSSQEHMYFRLYASRFAAWGILYNISSSVPLVNQSDVVETTIFELSVTTLPPSVSERCKADPHLLKSFLSSTVWRYVESPPLPPASPSAKRTGWVTKIASCPPGLVELINSRACRSAIMFNDQLNLEECKALIGRLADCVFPFMCAHGRPSMVPIVDLSRFGGASADLDGFSGCKSGDGVGFVEAWKKWNM